MDDRPPLTASARMAAGAVFVDDAGRVLPVRPSYEPTWRYPAASSGRGSRRAPAASARSVPLDPRLARRLTVALEARHDQRLGYLEHGAEQSGAG